MKIETEGSSTAPYVVSRTLKEPTRRNTTIIREDRSEFLRSRHLAGIRARHPQWSEEEVVNHVVRTQYRIDLPGRAVKTHLDDTR